MHRSLFLPLDAVQMRLVASVPKQFCTVDDEKSPSCLSQKTPKKMQIAWNKKAAGLNSNWSQPRCRGPSFYWCDPQKTLREVMMMVMSCCFFRILKAWSFPPKKHLRASGFLWQKRIWLAIKTTDGGFGLQRGMVFVSWTGGYGEDQYGQNLIQKMVQVQLIDFGMTSGSGPRGGH